MKIGLVLPGFSASERDWCIPALLNLVRRLAVENCVHVFALEYPYRRAVYPVYGATVHCLGGCNRGKAYAPRLWLAALSAIYAEHRRAHFDVLHAFWVNEPGALALLAGRTSGVPVVASVGGGELVGIPRIRYGGQLNRLERGMVRMVVGGADRVTVGSRYLQQIATRWRSDAVLAPLGVDVERFAPGAADNPDGSLTILNVASLVPVKQQLHLLDGFAMLDSQDTRLEIIGGGTLERYLRDHARALGIADRVAFIGEVTHTALTTHYRAADLFVQSSLHEAQGMAVLEAAACGIPLAGTPVGILPELAAAGGALRARGFGSADLANVMRRAVDARASLGGKARDTVERCFTVEETYTQWMELYRQVLRA